MLSAEAKAEADNTNRGLHDLSCPEIQSEFFYYLLKIFHTQIKRVL